MAREEDLRDLYVGCYRRLVTMVLATTGDLAAAEEAVQEAFIRALQRPRALQEADNPEAWLCTVARNVARSRWRRLQRLRSIQPEPPQYSQETSPDHVYLMQGLRALPSQQREAVVLHHLADLSVAEVARITNVPPGTVKARLSRGRARLAEILDDTEVLPRTVRGQGDR